MTQHPTDPVQPDAQPTAQEDEGFVPWPSIDGVLATQERVDDLRAEVAVLAARVARLTAVLEQTVAVMIAVRDPFRLPAPDVAVIDRQYAIARAALAGDSDG